MENNVDPDQLASEKSADLDLYCFQTRIQESELKLTPLSAHGVIKRCTNV